MIRMAAVLLALAGPAGADNPLPFDLGGPYSLVNQHGTPWTQTDPDGHAQLVFFGYANCPGICSAAMPLIADVVDSAAQEGVTLRPVMITVDPDRDTPANMGAPLAKIHPDFIGLTGTARALAGTYAAYHVERTYLHDDPEYGPVYSHGSLIYLMDGSGEVLTFVPPVLDAPRATAIALSYLKPAD